MAVQARLIRIGNSHGIRVPKSMRDQCGFGDIVELSVEDGALIVRRAPSVRAGWEDAFREMNNQGDDVLPDWESGEGSEWDAEEWEW